MHTIEFTLRGDDASGDKLRAMVGGIASQMNDKSVQIRTRMVFEVQTDAPDVAAILKTIAAKGNSNGATKKTYKKKNAEAVTEEISA